MAITLSPIHKNIQETLIDKMNMLQKGQFKEMSDKGVPIYGGANNTGAIGEPVTDGTGPKFNYMFARTVWSRMSSFLVHKDQTPIVLEGGQLDKYGRMRSGLVNRSVTINKEKDEKLNFSGLYNPEDNQPYRPIAGVKDINVEYRGGGMKLGATRTAIISWTCWTWDELEDLKPFFLKHGRAVLLEWGWSYPGMPSEIRPVDFTIKNDKGLNVINKERLEDIVRKMPERTLKNKGQYDGMVGVVQNFEWSVRSDGGFDCTTTLVSLGVTLIQQALKSNVRGRFEDLPVWRVTNKGDVKTETGFWDKFWGVKLLGEGKKVKNLNPYYNFNAYMRTFDNQLAINAPNSKGTILYIDERVSGENYSMAKLGPFCTWGWFEDNVISRFCGNINSDKPISEFRSIETIYDSKGNVSGSEPVRIRNSEALLSPDLNKFILFGLKKGVDELLVATKGPLYDKTGVGTETMDKWYKIFTDDTTLESVQENNYPEILSQEKYLFGGVVHSDVKHFTPLNDKTGIGERKGVLRNVYFAWDHLKSFFENEDDILNGVRKIWSDFSNQLGSIYNFKIDYDDDGGRLLIRDVGWTKSSVEVIHQNKSQSNTGKFNTKYKNDGLFIFPIWEANSITKSQNLTAKLPSRMQMAAMYGAGVKVKTKTEKVDIVEGDETSTATRTTTITDDPGNSSYDDYAAIALGKLDEGETKTGKELYDNMISGDMKHAFMEGYSFGNVDASTIVDDIFHPSFREVLNPSNALKFKEGSSSDTVKVFVNEEKSSKFLGLNDIVDTQVRSEVQRRLAGKVGAETGVDLDDDKVKEIQENWKNRISDEGSGITSLYHIGKSRDGDATAGITDETSHIEMKEEYKNIMINTLKGTEKGIVNISDPLVPLELEIEIDGTGGIFPGNAFHSSYLPNIYFDNTVFQAVGVSHKIDSSGWTTTLKGQMRVKVPPVEDVEIEVDDTTLADAELTDRDLYTSQPQGEWEFVVTYEEPTGLTPEQLAQWRKVNAYLDSDPKTPGIQFSTTMTTTAIDASSVGLEEQLMNALAEEHPSLLPPPPVKAVKISSFNIVEDKNYTNKMLKSDGTQYNGVMVQQGDNFFDFNGNPLTREFQPGVDATNIGQGMTVLDIFGVTGTLETDVHGNIIPGQTGQ